MVDYFKSVNDILEAVIWGVVLVSTLGITIAVIIFVIVPLKDFISKRMDKLKIANIVDAEDTDKNISEENDTTK